ncbi:aspartate/glutamate racemase family protein [Lacrimispora sp.]|uniref:aspartate/glutamate racemase family protein n=1 Tax=Lacrimispora sp. TaxID=2719234 RepID=UPI003460A0BC
MKKIALLSITLNAVNPMTSYLLSKPDITVVNYLDSYLGEKIKADGTINDESMGRLLQMLTLACRDRADGIILTCTVFSPYIEQFQKLCSVPIIGADAAMFDRVGKHGGSTALLCTFMATLAPSKNQLAESYLRNGSEGTIEVFWLEDAYKALQQQDLKNHNDYIIKQARLLDGCYDNIVLAQISMADAAACLDLQKSRVFTSPQAAYELLLKRMEQEGIV